MMRKRQRSRQRIVGEHFTADGKPKRRFDSHAEAMHYAERYGYNVTAYRCTLCDGWHLATRRTPRWY
jgi:hypothetical protein